MKSNYAQLEETAHGFIIFDPAEIIEDRFGDSYHMDSICLTYDAKSRNRMALRYIQMEYMITGVTAREFLAAQENNDAFWDQIDLFWDAEVNFDDCYGI